jgi:glutathione S-transferase
VKLHRFRTDVRADIDRHLGTCGRGHQRFGGPFLAGPKFGAVDAFFCAGRLPRAELRARAAARGRGVRRAGARAAAMRRWYAEALAEPYRDPPHEAEIAQAGAILKDLRAPARDTARRD